MKRETFATLQDLMVAEKKAISCFTDKFLRRIEKIVVSISTRQGKIITTGIGKSAFVAQKCAATLTSLGNFAVFIHPADAFHGDSGIIRGGDVVIAFSHSGESVEVVRLYKHLKKYFGVTLVAITGYEHSILARISDHVVHLPVTNEGSPTNSAPMASVTGALVVADLISVGLISPDFSQKHFVKYHPGGKLGLSLTMVKEVMMKKDLPVMMHKVTLKKAVEFINVRKKGVVGIIEKRVLRGVITDGDVRRMFVSGLVDTSKPATDFMTKNPRVISESKSLFDALQLMEQWKITSLFVVDSMDRVVGFIHMHDIIESSLI